MDYLHCNNCHFNRAAAKKPNFFFHAAFYPPVDFYHHKTFLTLFFLFCLLLLSLIVILNEIIAKQKTVKAICLNKTKASNKAVCFPLAGIKWIDTQKIRDFYLERDKHFTVRTSRTIEKINFLLQNDCLTSSFSLQFSIFLLILMFHIFREMWMCPV